MTTHETRLSPAATYLPAAAIALIALGGVLQLAGQRALGAAVWLGGLVITGAPVVWRTVRDAVRGRFATDVVAMLAIVTAVLLREPLAGLIIVLMQTGGEALEHYAGARASAALRELEAAAPRLAHRIVANTEGTSARRVEDVAADDVLVGDTLLVRPGELVPCDGVVVDGRSAVDASRLTGEPVPISAGPGTKLMSGSINGDGALTLRATAIAGESQYARIVELVRSAQESKAPLQRLADRYAIWFTPATLLVCAAVWWLTGDWTRVLAVLVVATPCPLILATPVAIVSGISRAATRQIIVRHGGALEQLAAVDTAVFDKTGTITIGRPAVSAVRVANGFAESELLRLSAAVEQGSSHALARSVVDAAHARGLALPPARHLVETAGRGLAAEVDGRDVSVGARAYVLERFTIAPEELARVETGGDGLRAYVAIDSRLAGVIHFADQLRPDLDSLFRDLRALGVDRTLLLSGDHTPNVRTVAELVGITEAKGDLLPEDKVAVVHQLEHAGNRVLMVGDGTNDAPALSSAHVGVALAQQGGGITAEAADVVILADDLTRVAEAVRIGRRTLTIARQSIVVGLGLSAVAMLFAARGSISPVQGSILQEAIDVAVILNALRALR